ncbi:MAG: alpha/beta hydrolase-fold protein, partial [Gammaproteobacteria bacterium]
SFLRSRIDESGISNVVVAGNSMGGYAALLFGILINANVVHAFSPHTNLKNPKLIRKKSQLLHVHNNYSRKYFDVKKVIKSHRGSGVFNVYFDSGNDKDNKHAMHIKRMRNVTLHPFDRGNHNVVRVLRDSGELRDIIISSLNDVPSKE